MNSIAIIGSGPAGCYLADHLLRLLPDVHVDILERLPVPFGLVRYGVAPDHQGTKAIARVLERTLGRERISFFGNVEVGRDVSLDEMRLLYDAVVLATGAWRDRRLSIPGEDLSGVVGSAAFTGWYNSHPERSSPAVNNVRSAIVIGNGNVALDVARVLAKSPAEMIGSDLSLEAAAWLEAQPIAEIHIVGRRGAADTGFSEHELAELGRLERAMPLIAGPHDLAGESPVLETLRGFDAAQRHETPVTIRFHFHLTPHAFVGEAQLRAVQFRRADGSIAEVPAQLAVTCIGYEARACCNLQLAGGVFTNQEGRIVEGLYVVGWAKRGPSGTIPTNRTEAQQLAQRIAAEVAASGRAGGEGLRELLARRNVGWVDYAAWRRIDAAEVARAGEGRSRLKFSAVAQMLEAAQARGHVK